MNHMPEDSNFFVRRVKSLYSFQKVSTRLSLAYNFDWKTNVGSRNSLYISLLIALSCSSVLFSAASFIITGSGESKNLTSE